MSDLISLVNDNSTFITLIIALVSTLISLTVCILTYLNLKELKNTKLEESRAQIVFYIDKIKHSSEHLLIMKNYGSSLGKVIEFSISPELDYSKTKFKNINLPMFYNTLPIILAANQSICSAFDFSNYPDKLFNIRLKYTSLGKTFEENYQLDISYRASVLHMSPSSSEYKDTAKAMQHINESLDNIVDKML